MSDLNLPDVLTRKVGPLPLGAWLLVVAGGLFLGYRNGGVFGAGSDGDTAADGAPAVDDPASWTGGYPGGSMIALPDGSAPITPIIGGPVPAPVITPSPVVTPVTAPKPVPVTTSPVPAPTSTTAPAPTTTRVYYTIRSGDTLSAIAKRYRTTLTQLLLWNRTVLDAAARAHGKTSSMGGHWIYPGTRIRVR